MRFSACFGINCPCGGRFRRHILVPQGTPNNQRSHVSPPTPTVRSPRTRKLAFRAPPRRPLFVPAPSAVFPVALPRPPAMRWLGMAPPPVFLVALPRPPAERSLASAPRPLLIKNGLLCSCKEVTKKHARMPRPRPAARSGASLAPRGFAGGAETRFADATLRQSAPRVYFESSRETPLHSARQTGLQLKTTAVPAFVVMDGGRAFRPLGHARPAAAACRAPGAGAGGLQTPQGVARATSAGIPLVLTFRSRGEPLAEGASRRKQGAACLSGASSAPPARGARSKVPGRPSGAFFGYFLGQARK